MSHIFRSLCVLVLDLLLSASNSLWPLFNQVNFKVWYANLLSWAWIYCSILLCFPSLPLQIITSSCSAEYLIPLPASHHPLSFPVFPGISEPRFSHQLLLLLLFCALPWVTLISSSLQQLTLPRQSSTSTDTATTKLRETLHPSYNSHFLPSSPWRYSHIISSSVFITKDTTPLSPPSVIHNIVTLFFELVAGLFLMPFSFHSSSCFAILSLSFIFQYSFLPLTCSLS